MLQKLELRIEATLQELMKHVDIGNAANVIFEKFYPRPKPPKQGASAAARGARADNDDDDSDDGDTANKKGTRAPPGVCTVVAA